MTESAPPVDVEFDLLMLTLTRHCTCTPLNCEYDAILNSDISNTCAPQISIIQYIAPS